MKLVYHVVIVLLSALCIYIFSLMLIRNTFFLYSSQTIDLNFIKHHEHQNASQADMYNSSVSRDIGKIHKDSLAVEDKEERKYNAKLIKDIECTYDDNDRELSLLRQATSGGRYHKCTVARGNSSDFDVFYEADGFYENEFASENHSTYLIERKEAHDKHLKMSWRFEILPVNEIRNHYFESEIGTFVTSHYNTNILDHEGKKCQRNSNRNSKTCTFIPTKQISTSEQLIGVYVPNRPMFSLSNVLFTKYQPSQNRKRIFNMVDIANLVYEQCNMSKNIQKSSCRIVLIGDSQSGYDFEAMLFSIERTFGGRVSFVRTYKTDNYSLKFYTDNVNYTRIMSMRDAQIEFLLPNQPFPDLRNSTKKHFPLRRRIYISHIRQNFGHYNKDFHDSDALLLQYLCGIPIFAYNENRDGWIDLKNKDIHAKVIIMNDGVHYYPEDTTFYEEVLAAHLDAAKKCKMNDVHIIFRETYPQHFANNYDGQYNRSESNHYIPSVLPSRQLFHLRNTTNQFCLPSITVDYKLANWRLESLMHASQLSKSKMPIKVHSLDDDIVCRASKQNNFEFDVIPTFPYANYFWWNHLGKDCTHFIYTPSFHFPYYESLYKILLGYSLNQTKPNCLSLHDLDKLNDTKNNIFIQGPEAMHIQNSMEAKGLKLNIYYAGIKNAIHVSDTIDQSYLSDLFTDQ